MEYVIIGSSAAGTAAARAIISNDPAGKITMITMDSGFYSRCQLHLAATGKRDDDKIFLSLDDLLKSANFKLIPQTKVTGMDVKDKNVILENGMIISYDKLLIATGSRTFFPPIPGLTGSRSFGLRNLEDAKAIKELLPCVSCVAIIGAGLVGVELAGELAEAGINVSLIEVANRPLPLQLEDVCGKKCADLLEQSGVDLYLGEMATEVIRDVNGNPQSVELKSGKSVPAEIVICAAGVRSNIEFTEGTGMEINRGIVIDTFCRTNVADVYAAGDVAETTDSLTSKNMPSAIWPVAVRQGKVAGANMSGGEDMLTRNTGMKASVNVAGTHVVSIGPVTLPEPEWKKYIYRRTDSSAHERLRIVYIDENKTLRAALLWGDVRNAGLYHEAIVNHRNISDDLKEIDSLNAAKRGEEELSVI